MAIDLNKRNDYHEVREITDAQETEVPENVMVKRQRLFAHPFSISGRIRRLEFALSFIIYHLCLAAITTIDSYVWCLLLFVLVVWFGFAALCKRFHDTDKFVLHIFTLIIPLYNLYVWFMLFFEDGNPYENDFGPDPKGRNMFA